MLVHEQLRRFEGSIVAATRNGGMVVGTIPVRTAGGAVGTTTSGFESDKGRWSFSEALLYSVTVITTIGHGNLTPKSSAGKIATILYALIGVPLMLMCLSSLGGLLAEALQCTYMRICCRLQKVRQHHKQKHQQKQQQQNNRTTIANGLGRKSSDSTGLSSCHGQSHEMDCNSSKYDPIMEETSAQNSYKYVSSVEREDSCQLLHNSPTPNSSPCIQLKSQPLPSPNLKQYNQQHLVMAQQHQQLHYQMTPTSQHRSYQIPPTRTPNNTSTTYHQQVMVPNSVHSQHQHLVEQNGSTEITGTATIYFPFPTTAPPGSHNVSMPVAAAAAAVHYNHQPLVKYHTIQLQHKNTMAGITATPGTTAIGGPTIFKQLPGHMTVGTGTSLTLPPPPHYQTATVHGIRRAKFLAKPMPQEINTLLAERDITCFRDSCANQKSSGTGSDSGNSSSTPGSVDIMEDEEENEQNRIGCPHGTPSRVPLIPSSPAVLKSYLGQDSCKTTLDTRRSSSTNVVNDNKLYGQQSRRVQLMTKKNSNSKEIRKQNCCLDNTCNLHTYSLTTEDEDFDDEDDNGDEKEDNMDGEDEIPQVPITIVLLILVAYICLGTVIFALWENWSLIDGAYFCFVTLSTIGYGDFMPEHTFRGPSVQLFACYAYLLLGLVLVAMSFSILETQLMWKCKRIAVRLKLTRND